MKAAALRKSFLVSVAALWCVIVCVGMGFLVDYETRPGEAAIVPTRWPANSRITTMSGQHHLVMFAHPRCPCTRASIGELALIMAHARDRLTADVLFVKPREFETDWVTSDLWRSADSIPGVTSKLDTDGAEARRFGANTSGQVVLYDGAGRLLFSGGITASRGHSGDNLGRSTIASLLNNAALVAAPEPANCSVYGCPLFDVSDTRSGAR